MGQLEQRGSPVQGSRLGPARLSEEGDDAGIPLTKGRSMETKETKIARGSGNVFADLGHPAAAHLLKAELVSRIDEIIRRCGLKQVEAAQLLGLSQLDVSRLLRGHFREYSLDRLLRLLTALGRDVAIIIRPAQSPRGGRLSVGTTELP